LDFYRIAERQANKNGVLEVFPDFKVIRSKDLMVRGRSFYAIWDEEKGLWSTDEYDVQRLIDDDLFEYQKENDGPITLKLMGQFSSNSWLQFRNYVGHLSDANSQLDEHLTFANSAVKKSDFVSRRLPYALEGGDISAYKGMFELLYAPEELEKLEWAIGSIIAGDARYIQKFFVLYGEGGTGKSTWLNLVQALFDGYYTAFEAKALTGTSNAFATEAFKSNPLVAIQHDGDLSKIEDNTKLNSIISHEEMTMNEKYRPSYTARSNAMLLMGTNKPVKISDGKSGIIRRLIDVRPTGKTHSPRKYAAYVSQMSFELGAIAQHCLNTYLAMGKNYYAGYKPVEMMLQTDIFFNFIEDTYITFQSQDGTTLSQAYELYKVFCDESNIEYRLARHKFRDELKNYFSGFDERFEVDGIRVRSWYSGFKAERFKVKVGEDARTFSLVMDDTESLMDDLLSAQPAQYSNAEGTPTKKWEYVTTTLADLDTSREHYVKVPTNHIIIDFDLKDADGNKSSERNLEAASTWPATYAEFSKGGAGIHLHYTYEGDASDLARVFDSGIEIKVFNGDASLRRRVSRCNSVPVATIREGLPVREKKVISEETIKSERALRDLVMRNLRKEIHPSTKPSIDFIHQILDDAYKSGLEYDLIDLRSRILSFANSSSNQAMLCVKSVQTMQFKSENVLESMKSLPKDERLVIFDLEVFPNLFIICWKYSGEKTVVRMVNPTAQQVETLFALKLIGYNCRRYDNHILYAAYMGYTNHQLYELSQKLINGHGPGAYFAQAYNISYADIYDFSSKKQSLKKFEIELGLTHVESELPWDLPVDPALWQQVEDYCVNDVNATDAVLLDRWQDFVARQILADLSGLSVNSTTQQHTSKIVFGDDRRPQDKFKYTHLAEMFPGYRYDMGTSTYRDEIVGEGGLVRAKPGMYENVALLDVASMHPTSIEQLDMFGEYTKNFSQLKAARIAIKHHQYDEAKKMLGGKLSRHLSDEAQAEALSYALKIVINIVYGLTSAKFDNSFRDPRNIDNIVAKRGALFMIDLMHFVEEQGFVVAHIKTDSIKIPNATPEIIEQVMGFGRSYGYDFEHEATYEKFCLVNDAVYIAKYAWAASSKIKPGDWTAVGAQFQHPYVYKTLFTGDPIKFEDMCETKTVSTALYLDFGVEMPMFNYDGDNKHFVGRAGMFVPILPDCGGGSLLRVDKDGVRFHSATGAKNYLWKEAEVVKTQKLQDDIDLSFFETLVYEARQQLDKFCDATIFLS